MSQTPGVQARTWEAEATTLAPQQHMNSPVAIANARLANLSDALFQSGLSGATGFVVIRRCVDLEHATRPSDRYVPFATHLINQLALPEPSRAFNQCSDGGAAKTENEITLPMSWHGTVGDLYRAMADHDLGRYEVLASPTRARSRHSEHPPGA